MNVVFPCCANWETFVADTECFWTKSETSFVSATNVVRAGKRGNICVGNNVSSFARAFRDRSQRSKPTSTKDASVYKSNIISWSSANWVSFNLSNTLIGYACFHWCFFFWKRQCNFILISSCIFLLYYSIFILFTSATILNMSIW